MKNFENSDTRGPDSPSNRRGFLGITSIILGVSALLGTALVTAFEVLYAPIRPKKQVKNGEKQENSLVFVTKLESIPKDGTPGRFKVFKQTSDAWTKYESQSVGNVFLKFISKDDAAEVLAWNARCPHAGCPISYRSKNTDFFCGCHDSRFTSDGALPEEKTHSPRQMDTLKVEIRNNDEVWVEFMDFQVGTKDKKPVS